MQFRVATGVENVDVNAVQCALRAVDPAALVDWEDNAAELRVSTYMTVSELMEAVDQAGYPITADQVFLVKSECCGGCGG